MRATLGGGLILAVVGCLAYGCGSDSGGAEGGGGSAASAGGGTGGSSASSGAGGSSGGGSGGAGSGGGGSGGVGGSSGGGSGGTSASGGWGADAGFPDVTFAYDGPPEDDGGVGEACAASTAEAKPVPLDMYIMLDNSGSMGTDCNIGSSTASKWCYSVNALDGFFQSPSSTGMGVALQYFPKCYNSSAACNNGGNCSTPEVPLGILQGNLAALQTSLNNSAPGGLTPTEAALRGIANYTAANQQPGRVMIGILVTDGSPTQCNTSANTLAGIVQAHLASTGIKTYVIGMAGANYATLDTIAAPGGAPLHTTFCNAGAPSCYYYDVGNGNPNAFIAVLQSIQQSAVSCQFAVPTSDGGLIDPNKISVEYSPGGNPPPQPLTKVDSAAQCGPQGGWYYDNNQNPTTITLCPTTCSVVQLDPNAKIEVKIACQGS